MAGRMNPNVLPEPVLAMEIKSRPESTTGHEMLWMVVGIRKCTDRRCTIGSLMEDYEFELIFKDYIKNLILNLILAHTKLKKPGYPLSAKKKIGRGMLLPTRVHSFSVSHMSTSPCARRVIEACSWYNCFLIGGRFCLPQSTALSFAPASSNRRPP